MFFCCSARWMPCKSSGGNALVRRDLQCRIDHVSAVCCFSATAGPYDRGCRALVVNETEGGSISCALPSRIMPGADSKHRIVHPNGLPTEAADLAVLCRYIPRKTRVAAPPAARGNSSAKPRRQAARRRCRQTPRRRTTCWTGTWPGSRVGNLDPPRIPATPAAPLQRRGRHRTARRTACSTLRWQRVSSACDAPPCTVHEWASAAAGLQKCRREAQRRSLLPRRPCAGAGTAGCR